MANGSIPDFWQKRELVQAKLERFKESLCLESTSLPSPVARMVDYIHANLFDPKLNVSMAKEKCRIRDNNITTYFKGCFGVGIREYIESARIEAAVYLIEQCDVEIYLVGMAVGYSHPETFHRAFQRCIGKAPTDYRRDEEESSRSDVRKSDRNRVNLTSPLMFHNAHIDPVS